MISNTDMKGAAVRVPIAATGGTGPAAFEFALAHHVPGRLRLRSAALKGNASASEQARHQLALIRGVTATSANPVTGSVLLEYDPSVISSSRVIDLLAAHGYVLRATEVEAEAGNRWADKMASVAMDWMIKCTRRAARAGRHHRTGLIPDRAMQVKQRFATYYRAAAARGRSLLTKATTPWHEICRRVGRPR